MFTYTNAIDKLRRLKRRIRVVQGGTWAGKTESIISIIAEDCILNKDKDYTVIAETIPAIKEGALKIFKSIMSDADEWFDEHYNATDRLYKFASGSQIKFSAFDTVGKAKASGKRTDLFVNEANYVSFPIVDELMTRTSGNVWIDYNPNNEFWVHKEVLGSDDVDYIKLTYLDNQTTPESIKRDFSRKQEKAKTSAYWKNWCRVYIEGELGSLEGVILKDWSEIEMVPPGSKLIGYGMDFGYTNDPTTWVACYLHNGIRIFDEVFYSTGLKSSAIADLMKQEARAVTYADSADPRLIDELYDYGLDVRGVTKGKDSINFGIDILQEQPFKVTARSLNLIRELRQYSWDSDRDGQLTNKPIDDYNHGIDAMRYLAIERLTKRAQPRRRSVTIGSYS